MNMTMKQFTFITPTIRTEDSPEGFTYPVTMSTEIDYARAGHVVLTLRAGDVAEVAHLLNGTAPPDSYDNNWLEMREVNRYVKKLGIRRDVQDEIFSSFNAFNEACHERIHEGRGYMMPRGRPLQVAYYGSEELLTFSVSGAFWVVTGSDVCDPVAVADTLDTAHFNRPVRRYEFHDDIFLPYSRLDGVFQTLDEWRAKSILCEVALRKKLIHDNTNKPRSHTNK